jgi:acyl-CoA reductase-like NAD-dependent aldehyde dehydrogenase
MTTFSTTDPAVTDLVIGGRMVPARETLAVHDPASPGEVVGYAAAATPEQTAEAVRAAEKAWPQWSATPPRDRARLLLEALTALEDSHDERVELLVRENGKACFEADIDLRVFAARCTFAAEGAPLLEEHQSLPAPPFRSEVHHLPKGVVTIIVPVNWPLAILGASLPFALVAGNTAIVKPPPTCPLAVSRTLAILAERLPPGVLNVVTGTNESVSPLIDSPAVRKIVFTGSTAAGKHIMAMASKNLTDVTLELGGNDPAIVLDDADLGSDSLRKLVSAAYLTSGQVCMAVKRVYVHRSRYDELVDLLSGALDTYVVGGGLADGVVMGPLHTAAQRDRVARMLDEARRSGAEVRELGTVCLDAQERGGHFLRPSLVLDPAPDLAVVVDEQFGPTLPILPYDDVDPLINQINKEWSGLCSSVWTADLDRASDLARRIRTGTTWINNANAVVEDDRTPFGGFRQSGVGRELGMQGVLDYTEPHSITYSP